MTAKGDLDGKKLMVILLIVFFCFFPLSKTTDSLCASQEKFLIFLLDSEADYKKQKVDKRAMEICDENKTHSRAFS